jgi:hypothetical protein
MLRSLWHNNPKKKKENSIEWADLLFTNKAAIMIIITMIYLNPYNRYIALFLQLPLSKLINYSLLVLDMPCLLANHNIQQLKIWF